MRSPACAPRSMRPSKAFAPAATYAFWRSGTTIASGPFYDAFTANREGWSLFTISAFNTPNLAGLDLESLLALSEDELDQNVRPYLTTRRWVKEKFHEWGLGHPLWESRVLGNFPKQSQDALISLTWL